jgi:signal transduction histidine kinase/CheY-like chemotaxis protein/tetratricopeptide (TPR) repeat protein
MRVRLKLNYTILLLLALLGTLCVKAGDADSIDRVIGKAGSLYQQVRMLNQVSREYMGTDPEKALHYNTEAMQILQQSKANLSDSLYLQSLFIRGLYYAHLQLFDSVIDIQTVVYNHARVGGQNLLAAIAVSERAIGYEYGGNNQKALTDYYTALRLYEQENDTRGIMHQYMNIGLIYQYQKKYDVAISYYRKAIAIGMRLKNEADMISAYNNLAIVYQEQKQYEKAISYFIRVLAFDIRMGDSVNIGGSYNNIGVVYHGMKNYAKALQYFKISLNYKEPKQDHEGIANTCNNLAEVYADMRSPQAVLWLEKALDIARKYKFNAVLLENYRIAKSYYEHTDNYKKALNYANLHQQLKDSMRVDEANVEIEQIQRRYEVEKAAKEITMKNAELDRSKYRAWIYLLLTLVVIVTAIYLYFTMQKTRLLNKQLSMQQQQIIDANNELIRKNEEAERARREAEEAVKAKSQFLSIMSHEIRTPLNAIIGLANLLSENNPRADQQKNINVLKTSSGNLLTLLSDILDFSKIEAGKMAIEQVDFSLKQLVYQLYNLFAAKATEKGLELRIQYDEKTPANLRGDSLHLNQVLLNLISNAIKFTKEGYVELGVKLEASEGDSYAIAFTVADTGIGIPLHQLNSIFDPFTQADSKTTREFGGTGLGLSISKQLLSMLGSQLIVKSQQGKGSEFTFVLQFKKSKQMMIPEQQENMDSTPDLSRVKILIVEDNAVNVFVIKQFLAKWNAETVVADNGEQAIEKIKATDFDVVLMDLHMPVMDGFEASRQILQLKPSSKIIAITATQETEISDELRETGIVDFVGKPFKPEELATKIRKVLMS